MSAALVRCDDAEHIMAFLEQDHIRYRHLIHYMQTPSPAWDDAMYAYYPSGVTRKAPPLHFVDDENDIKLLASLWDTRLRLDGIADHIPTEQLRQWFQELNPYGVLTTTEALTDTLAELAGQDGWSMNFHYSLTDDTLLAAPSHDVAILTEADREAAYAFLAQPSEVPFLDVARMNDNLRRDVDFFYAGLPGTCFVARYNGAIVGMVTLHPQTAKCDEISRLYVAPAHRCRGYGQALLSAASRHILNRGLISTCGVGGDTEILDRVLTGVGYRIACRFWHRRYWWDTVESRK